MRPIIGIPCYASERADNNRPLFGNNQSYVRALQRAGAAPVLLPPTADPEAISALSAPLDGLLLSGGGDVDPAFYGEDMLAECGAPDPERDTFELALARRALETKLPILGICRGMQLLNIVAGAYKGEFDQMGAWDDSMTHDDRYALTEEWTTIVKRLWSEDSVDFAGKYFTMKDCQSKPKPLSKPRPDLVCAGMSDRGFQFSVREADICFIGGRTPDERRDASLRAKKTAEAMGKTIKTFAMCTVVHGDTDADADAKVEYYKSGADMGAILAMLESWGVPAEKLSSVAAAQGAFMTHTVVGSPKSCGAQIEEFLRYCELDGLMMIFPDYVEGLTMFGAEILPGLRAVFS